MRRQPFARALGLDRLSESAWSALRLESSYDFERQMAVFVPADMCEPGQRGYLDRLEDLCPAEHRAKLVRLTDYVVRMTAGEVPDPYQGTADDFEYVLDLVEDACDGLVRMLLAKGHAG